MPFTPITAGRSLRARRAAHEARQEPVPPIGSLIQMAQTVDLNERARIRRQESEQVAAAQARLAMDWVFETARPFMTQAAWQGYAATEYGEACAVAWLGTASNGGSWWLHHQRIDDEGPRPGDAVLLIAPCACGGYRKVRILYEDDLFEVLAELPSPQAPVPCDRRQRIHPDAICGAANPARRSAVSPPGQPEG